MVPTLQPQDDPRLKTLFAFYHRQWWTYKQRWSHFKWIYTVLNALALLLVATGMIVGPIIKNSILVAVLSAVGTFLKGWNEFKQYRHKLLMSAFAYTTYAKALNELRQCVGVLRRRKPRLVDKLDKTLITSNIENDSFGTTQTFFQSLGRTTQSNHTSKIVGTSDQRSNQYVE